MLMEFSLTVWRIPVCQTFSPRLLPPSTWNKAVAMETELVISWHKICISLITFNLFKLECLLRSGEYHYALHLCFPSCLLPLEQKKRKIHVRTKLLILPFHLNVLLYVL